MLFKSSRLHGALPELAESSEVNPAEMADGKQIDRITLNLGFWDRPCVPFEEECRRLTRSCDESDCDDDSCDPDCSNRKPFEWEAQLPPMAPDAAGPQSEMGALEVQSWAGPVWGSISGKSTSPLWRGQKQEL